MAVFGKMFSNECGANATKNRFFSRNEALLQTDVARAASRAQFTIRLVVASCFFVLGCHPRGAARFQDRMVCRSWKRNSAAHVHVRSRARNAASAREHPRRLYRASSGALRTSTAGFFCINLGRDPVTGGIFSRRNCDL